VLALQHHGLDLAVEVLKAPPGDGRIATAPGSGRLCEGIRRICGGIEAGGEAGG